MDSKLSVQQHNGGVCKPPVHRKGGRRSGGGKGIKVVYISSPMMLTASAEEFRAVVQELTGRDSNVADHDLLLHAPSSSNNSSCWSSSSSSSYSSFGGRASAVTTAPSPQTMRTTATTGPGRPAEYAAGLVAAPPSFQDVYHPTGSLIYGQDYYW